jgi:hypothetical protein
MTLEEIQSRLFDDYHSNILKKVEKIILLLFQLLHKKGNSKIYPMIRLKKYHTYSIF